ncbi:hypothetical protein KKC16_01260, partial [Patescibacteria group bacterium]|nr:hypothetical protein [Patescibacteria group bacterium]
MKKLIILSMVFAMVFGMNGGVSLIANAAGDVDTSLTAGSTSGSRPIVKVKWEMKGPSFDSGDNYVGWTGGEGKDDDDTDPGSQLNAPGSWDADMHYTVCAIVTDPNGVGDVDGVFADISYPSTRPMHTSPSDPSDPNYDPDEIDDPSGGCGDFIEENTLIKLDKDDGIRLFCNAIRNDNHDLPVFSGYMSGDDDAKYEEICNSSTGELQQDLAYVYCDDKTLIWEDPAGLY